MPLLVRVLIILATIAVFVVAYLVSIWVLGMLGINIPQNILTAVFVLLGLIAAIYALTGRMDTFFR